MGHDKITNIKPRQVQITNSFLAKQIQITNLKPRKIHIPNVEPKYTQMINLRPG